MNHWQNIVSDYARLASSGVRSPAVSKQSPQKPSNIKAPNALMFSPHPDDECIVGGWALRLARESSWHVVNAAVTLGSNKARRLARLKELNNACRHLGIHLTIAGNHGLDNINPEARQTRLSGWNQNVNVIAEILATRLPRVVFIPHDDDGHPTHIGTHWLVMDALMKMPPDFQCVIVETEFWRQMKSPNILVEFENGIVADLMAALSLHKGEVRRNPYHLRLPAWLIDNVRRAESVLGHGSAPPNVTFGTLYRVRHWKNRRLVDAATGKKILSSNTSPALIFQ